MKEYFLNLVSSLSNFLNVILGGENSMTFSSRCHIGYWEDKMIFIVLRNIINNIFFYQEDHCRMSFMRDVYYSRKILSIYNKYKD